MAAQVNRLDALPREILAHIAICTNARTILRLSRTCRKIRAACHDEQIFRKLLVKAQAGQWGKKCLDIEAIAERARRDPNIWARYVLADEKAWDLAQEEHALDTPERFLSWLPELFVVKHPFMHHPCWGCFLDYPPPKTTAQMFCLTLAILANPELLPEGHDRRLIATTTYQNDDQTSQGFLWGMCHMILDQRKFLRGDTLKQIPPLPLASQIPLRPLNSTYELPLPFSPAGGSETTTSKESGWDSWYLRHSHEMLKASSDNLTSGKWSAQYTDLHTNGPRPPLAGVKFNITSTRDGDGPVQDQIFVLTDSFGLEGIEFQIRGTMFHRAGTTSFLASLNHKTESHEVEHGTTAHIDMRLTPFGLHGFWGVTSFDDFERLGYMWFWKEEWTET